MALSTTLPWAVVLGLHCPLGTEFPPHIQPKSPLFQFKETLPCSTGIYL